MTLCVVQAQSIKTDTLIVDYTDATYSARARNAQILGRETSMFHDANDM